MDLELVKQAGEFLEAAGEYAHPAIESMAAAGGYLTKEGSKIALGVLISKPIEALYESLSKAKRDGKVDPDFESTPRGAELLQEALNALLDGKTEEQAAAVRKVFLGLAQTEPEDALERVEQLDILQTVASLTPWELETLNLAERFRVASHLPQFAAEYFRTDQTVAGATTTRLRRDQQYARFDTWLAQLEGMDDDRKRIIQETQESLWKRSILAVRRPDDDETRWRAIVLPQGILGQYGWKIAQHLYSATSEAEGDD